MFGQIYVYYEIVHCVTIVVFNNLEELEHTKSTCTCTMKAIMKLFPTPTFSFSSFNKMRQSLLNAWKSLSAF